MEVYLDSTYTPDIIAKELANSNRQTILAVDPSLVGFMTLATDTTEPCLAPYHNAMELQRIYTDPSTHGTGLAKRLADRAAEIAREKGYDHTWLGVLPENTRAVGL
jgi:ribosomal protein S18 acetylase RimI-like enzyme